MRKSIPKTDYARELSNGHPGLDPQHFLNYEMSWLSFNWRVLDLAQDPSLPVLERVKFIGITASNLDEFFQKRVGGLKRQLQAGVVHPSVDGKTPAEQLKAIRAEVKLMIRALRSTFFEQLVPILAEKGIRFLSMDQLTPEQEAKMDQYFRKQLYPILTPLVVDQSHPFPLISNKSRSFAVELEDPRMTETVFARVKIPSNRPRWLTVDQADGTLSLLLIDDLIRSRIHRLFPGATIRSANVFRVTRNADVERNEEEADDLLELISEELRERRFAEVVRLEVDADTPEPIKHLLMEKMDVARMDTFDITGPIGLADAVELYKIKDRDDLMFPAFVPTLHPALRHDIDESAPDIFATIRKADFLVHHPYHSFATSVQRFIEQAATDPKVLAIKQTLYRTSRDSAVMHALMRAAQEGKQVAVLVELKARFDEERNIEWAQKLEKAGVHVAYGIAGLKIHTKVTMVVREEEDGLRTYCHIGTGNYHPDTAQLYEDMGLFTCDEDIGADVADLFNYLTGFAPNQEYGKLLVAPLFLRDRITALIEQERMEAEAGRPARIFLKMNNLEDPRIIDALYRASQAGVEIDAVVRSVTRLKAGVPGLSERIRVHSVVGRYLEHSRVYRFHHGGEDRIYIGSADMMHRNLDARVEALAPIEHPALKGYIDHVVGLYLADSRCRWELLADGGHRKVQADPADDGIHERLMRHALRHLPPVPMG